MTVFTGNNFTPTGELTRRVLTCRLDAQTERPYTRTFDFNPTEVCIAHRQALIGAGLTLLAGFVSAGRPKAAPTLGSFGQWDSLVRQSVLWIASNVSPEGLLGDPVQSILEHADTDPIDEAHHSLMQAMLECFKDRAVSARELLEAYTSAKKFNGFPTPAESKLADALDEFKSAGEMNAKSIGRVLLYRRDRIVGGMRIVRSLSTVGGVWLWRVRRLPTEDQPKNGLEGFKGFAITRSNLKTGSPSGVDGLAEHPQTQSNPFSTPEDTTNVVEAEL